MGAYLVVGASSGIGKALGEKLAQDGHTVYATYRNTPLESGNSNLHVHHLDVLAESLDLSFLPDVLDGVAYCPGAINLKPFHRLKPETFTTDFELQTVGAVKVLQAALPKLKGSEHASVVMFSTVAVQLGFPMHAQVAASKGAVEGLTRSLAAEWAPAIRVNAIAPSLTDTPLAERLLNSDEKRVANAQRHPLKKIGTAAEIAALAAFLLAGESGWITGQILHADGGMSHVKSA